MRGRVAVAAHGCNTHTQRGGPSRGVPARWPRVTGIWRLLPARRHTTPAAVKCPTAVDRPRHQRIAREGF